VVFRSPLPDVVIPDVPLTDFVLEHAVSRRDKPALVEAATGRTLTYGELADGVQRVAAGLSRRGFDKGDVLTVYSPNLPEYAVVFHGVASAGGAVHSANPLLTPDELRFQLTDARARLLVTVPALVEKAREGVEGTGVEDVLVIGEQSFAALLESDGEPSTVSINPQEDVVALPYSSGTTGGCKGVMLTHRNLVANICQLGAHLLADETTVALGVLPFFHIYGLVVVLNNTLRRGGTVVTMSRYDLEGMLVAIEEHRITHAFVVPPIVLALARQPAVEEHDLGSLHFVMSGAAPLGADLEQECIDRLGVKFRQGYGLTETSPVTHMVPHLPGAERLGSVGPPIPNSEVKIVDPVTGEAVGPGERGEVWVRGPHVMKGYLGNDDATAFTVDADGWLHSGDIGLADAEGYLTVVDRMKELIKVKGYQVAPAELEAVLLTHPAVADAAVVPTPDEEAGEVPTAYVVLRDECEAEEIVSFVAERVAPYKRIRRCEVIDAIPKSASGKILRRVLVERERARAGSRVRPQV
jgi:acyl-CoA synthetase (AMP-forming)/AMP-acid ligase II